MSLLSIVQNVAAAANTAIPTSIVGNQNADAKQWLALANLAGKEVARRHDWIILVSEATFTSTATVVQTDAIPSRFERFAPDVQLWDTSNSVMLTGPVSSNEWQSLVNSGVSGGSFWRRSGDLDISITPAPAAGDTFVFEYITKNYLEEAGTGTGHEEFLADTDFGRVSDHLIELGLTWRWLRAHGMDYAEELASYEREIEKAAARDRGIKVFVLERRSGSNYSWPGTITP